MSQATPQDCLDQAMLRMRGSGEFGNTAQKEKVFSVYSEEDLMDKAKFAKFPAVGIMYEGTVANSLDPSRQGLANDCRIALILMLDGKSVGGLDTKQEGARILTEMRKQFRQGGDKSPTGHKWKFVSEIQAGQIKGVIIFIQRWSTAIIMT